MKERIFNVIDSILIVALLCGCVYGILYNAATQASIEYLQVLEVIEVNDDLIYLIDCNGNEWIWEGAEGWNIDDYAIATMNTNGTEVIYDDIIVELRYTRIAAR